MKTSNGKSLILIGILHTLFSLTPDGFLSQWSEFLSSFFVNVSPHNIHPFIILDYKKEAAFWFISWGVLLIFFGVTLDIIENTLGKIPFRIRFFWLSFAVMSSVMLPISGFPILILPQAIWMVIRK